MTRSTLSPAVALSLAAALLVIACHPAGSAKPATPPGPRPPRVVALISADAEWRAVMTLLPGAELHDTPFGSWFLRRVGQEDVVFYHGGWGKVAAAGSTQYAIDRWHPALLINLGACGGFGARKVGDIVLVSETTIYDIVEQMGDAAEAIAAYQARLDTSVWPARLAGRVVVGPIVSADRDLDPTAVAGLAATYHASAGDWESGAIAWVAARNHTRALILRSVSDVVDAPSGDDLYGADDAWQRAAAKAMASLIALFDDALPDLVR